MRTAAFALFAIIAGTVASLIPAAWWRGTGAVGTGGSIGTIPITMTVWGMPFEDRLFADTYCRGYEAIAPVRVDYQRHADVFAKYNAWHAKGEGVEVMRIGVDYYHQLVMRRMLEDLTPYIENPVYGLSEDQLSQFPARLVETLRVDGRLYALPEDNAMYGLYYNKGIFDAYNAAHPDARVGYPNADWSWDDVRRTARLLTGTRAEIMGDGASRQSEMIQGIDIPIWAFPFFNFFAQAGGQLWSEDQLTTEIASDAGVEALLFMRTLIKDGSWKPSFGQDTGTGPSVDFKAGRLAMMYGGSWWVPNFEENAELDFAVAPSPRGKVRATVTGSVLWGMSVNAKEKQAGWRMIRWLVLEEQAATYWNVTRVAPPAHLGVLESERFRSTTGLRNPSAKEGEDQYFIPPMPPERFEDRAAWMLDTWRPDPTTGEAPGFLAAGLYQQKLQNAMLGALTEYLANPGTPGGGDGVDPREVLERAARDVHNQIDGDRRAIGLDPVRRD